jgi:hypothetical protein
LGSETINQVVNLGDGETSHVDVELDVRRHQLFKLEPERLFVPPAVESDLVVGQQIGSLLGAA